MSPRTQPQLMTNTTKVGFKLVGGNADNLAD